MAQYKGLENKKILIVEDVELNQYLARHIMESWGCKVEVVENGSLAVKRISEIDFDIVLMDIQMPVMDGIEATRLIRQMDNEHKSSVPIVALTANVARADYEAYQKVGMNDCLPKPFEEAALFNMVFKNIRKAGATENGHSAAEQAAPQAAVEENVKMYDLSMVETISGGDKSFILKMLRLFLDTVPGTLSDIQSAFKASDWMLLSKQAHKLKSTIDSMGIAALKKDIRAIESNGKTGQNLEEMPALVQKVIDTMNAIMQQVKDHSL